MTEILRLTDLEFVVAWEDSKHGFLPHPFIFTSRTPLWNDYMREKRRIRERMAGASHDHVREIVELLAQPDIRLEVGGWDPRNVEDPGALVRLLAVRRGSRGILATQLPGETVRHSGGYTFAEFDAIALAEKVVAALPESNPGTRPEVVLADRSDAETMDYSYGRSEVLDSFDDSLRHRTQEFLDSPVTSMGMIRIVQGRSRFGPRGRTMHELTWRDVEDDGRYAFTEGIPQVARAVDDARLTAMINIEIAAVVRAIKDERA